MEGVSAADENGCIQKAEMKPSVQIEENMKKKSWVPKTAHCRGCGRRVHVDSKGNFVTHGPGPNGSLTCAWSRVSWRTKVLVR